MNWFTNIQFCQLHIPEDEDETDARARGGFADMGYGQKYLIVLYPPHFKQQQCHVCIIIIITGDPHVPDYY